MEPWLAAGGLALIMLFGVTCYFFRIPEDLRKRPAKVGIWGPPNAEFNWCEPDYLLADWLAEPVNTVSNLAIILPPLAFLAMHDVTTDVAMLASIQVAIGIASVLFHGSLRYSMQLCDELPIFWYVLATAAGFSRRLGGPRLEAPAAAVGVIVSCAVLATTQHSATHEASRGVMVCSFGVCAVAIAWGSTRVVARLKEELTDKRRCIAARTEIAHSASYVMFVLAALCWLGDNYLCRDLRRLPLGLPYPHLHMWWHLLTGAVLYSTLVLLQVDDQRRCADLDVSFAGALPLRVRASG